MDVLISVFNALVDWLGHYQAFWRERFDDLEKLLKESE